MASHKHCIFCGEEVPVPRPTNWNLACDSPLNTMTPDTVGKRYHAVIVGSAKRESTRASEDAPATPQYQPSCLRLPEDEPYAPLSSTHECYCKLGGMPHETCVCGKCGKESPRGTMRPAIDEHPAEPAAQPAGKETPKEKL